MKNLFVMMFLFLSNFSFSESYSNVSEIKAMTVGYNHARIKLNSMVAGEGCTRTDWYWFDISQEKGLAMYAGLLASKITNQKISIQLIGCEDNMAKVSHVYFCDTRFCH